MWKQKLGIWKKLSGSKCWHAKVKIVKSTPHETKIRAEKKKERIQGTPIVWAERSICLIAFEMRHDSGGWTGKWMFYKLYAAPMEVGKIAALSRYICTQPHTCDGVRFSRILFRRWSGSNSPYGGKKWFASETYLKMLHLVNYKLNTPCLRPTMGTRSV